MFIKQLQKNCLCGAVKIRNTDDSDPDKWQYSGYGVGFDSTGFTQRDNGKHARNFVVLGADMSNSRHSTNKTQSVLVLGHGLIQKINNTTIYAEKMYSPNFTVDSKTCCLSLHYNGKNSYLFANGKEVTKFKAKNSELIKHSMCLGGILYDYYIENKIKYTGLYGDFYDFSVNYSAITNDKILDIQKYLMEKNNIV